MIRFLSEFGGISSRLFASCPDKVSSCSPKCAGKDRFSLKVIKSVVNWLVLSIVLYLSISIALSWHEPFRSAAD